MIPTKISAEGAWRPEWSACMIKHTYNHEEMAMLSTVLWVVLILALIGALPTWPYSTNWGYYPSGGLGLILIILLVLALTGK